MAARTIESPRDRLVTILVAPLISCSARLPVYTLLIGAFVPPTTVLGVLSLPALVMFGLYAGGMAAALALAWALQRTLLRGTSTTFIMELPTYRLPSLRSVLLQTWEKVRHFLERAGTIILGASILLWFLATYPRSEGASAADQLRDSFAGRAGRLIEPVILPLGFDWKIGIGIVSSLLQREVFVSTMGTIYSVRDAGDGSASLAARLRADTDPATGRPLYTLATALSLLVYYMFAMQCLSTVAVVRKETGGWRWPLFQFGVMTLMAWGGAFVVYRAGVLLGGG
jgi:ferrous iron transport protein B